LLALAPAAHAASFEADETYTLAEGETHDGNLYAFGNYVLIEGTVDGDLAAAGSRVEIAPTGRITGDLMAAGSEVRVAGTVEGDIRGAGFLVIIDDSATVGGEVLGAGFNVSLASGATVAGDFWATGYQAMLDGAVGGDAHVSGAAVRIAGTVDGDASVSVDASGGGGQPMMFPMFGMPALPETLAPGFYLPDTAAIAGNLDYEFIGSGEPDVSPSASVGGVITEELREATADAAQPETPLAVRYARGVASHFVALVLLGVLGFWLLPRIAERVYAGLADAPLAATGWGCLTLILVPVALMLLLFAVVFLLFVANLITLDGLNQPIVWFGSLVGSMLVFGTLFLAWVGRAIVAMWIGRWIWGRAGRDTGARFWPLVVGSLIVAVIVELPLPVVGSLLGWLVAVMGLGGFIMAWKVRAVGEPPVEGLQPTAA
jgi:cytoskeletal protein CcmA (bactofilin family)